MTNHTEREYREIETKIEGENKKKTKIVENF